MKEKQQDLAKKIVTNLDIVSCLDFKVVKEEREYSFHMPMGAPLGEAFDAVFSVLEKIRELQANAIAKAGEAAEAEVAEEEKGK